MAKVIEGLYYSETHEYVRVEGDYGYIGITDYAQNALGNVVYVDMPEEDDEVTAGEEFGAVESVKAASDLISPVSGTVVEVNGKLEDGQGFIIVYYDARNPKMIIEAGWSFETLFLAILGAFVFMLGRIRSVNSSYVPIFSDSVAMPIWAS